MKNTNSYSFWNGWHSVAKVDHNCLQTELMAVLGIASNVSFHYRRRGAVKHTMIEGRNIEQVFAKYKVPASKVWGGKCNAKEN